MTDPRDLAAAKDALLRALKVRALSEAHAARRLEAKGFAKETADRAVADLKRVGLLDDRAYADDTAERLSSGAPAAAPMVRARLRAKGVEERDADAAAERHAARPHDAEAATEAARRRLLRASIDRLDDDAAMRRLVGYLARRGFEPETAREAARAALREAGRAVSDADSPF